MREAVIRIPFAEFEAAGLHEFISLCRTAGLRNLTELVCQGEGCLMVVTVESPIPEAELSALDYLAWWERLTGTGDTDVYLCKIAVRGFEEGSVEPLQELGVSNSEIRVDDDGMEVTLVGPQSDISRGIDAYDDAGMSVFLSRITDYDGPKTPLDALTERQRETLETAFDLGYFEVPRGVSMAAIADELDLDPSTVADHLQRAERNLVTELLASP